MSDTLPDGPDFTPAWLAPADVKSWLRLNSQPTDDDALITSVCAATEPYIQRCRPEWLTTDDVSGAETYEPDPETYQGAVMHAAREYRRRNSPAGIELLDGTTSFVSRYDPDIEKALQTGAYAPPTIA